ncbi:MAG: BON domain-containing protein [Bryobacteraceae bacterium]
MIYDKVRLALANDREVKGGAIDVKVQQGVVELNGKVRAEKQKLHAEKAARKVKGVQRVENRLTIAPL